MVMIFIAAGTACAEGWNPLMEMGPGGMRESVSILKQASASGAGTIAPSPVNREKLLVCIDPGHPSPFSAGTAVSNGTTEGHINWVVARKLQRTLEDMGVEVMMTKSSEGQEIDNRVRALMINEAAEKFMKENKDGAALTVHLHCDAGPQKGFAVFYPDQQGNYSGITGHEPGIGTIGPSKGIQAASRLLADAVHSSMAARLQGSLNDLGVKGDSKTLVGGPGHQGALTFSIFSKIPTVTIEMVTLTNASDAKFIKTEIGQQQMAEAIAAGVTSR